MYNEIDNSEYIIKRKEIKLYVRKFNDTYFIETTMESWISERISASLYTLKHIPHRPISCYKSKASEKIHGHRHGYGKEKNYSSFDQIIREIINHYKRVKNERAVSDLEAKGLL